jgi:hypothetical protein
MLTAMSGLGWRLLRTAYRGGLTSKVTRQRYSAQIGWEVHRVRCAYCISQSAWGRRRRARSPRLPKQSRCRPDSFREVRYERLSRYDIYPQPARMGDGP